MNLNAAPASNTMKQPESAAFDPFASAPAENNAPFDFGMGSVDPPKAEESKPAENSEFKDLFGTSNPPAQEQEDNFAFGFEPLEEKKDSQKDDAPAGNKDQFDSYFDPFADMNNDS